ncbi:universal stress protein UspA [Ferrimonas sediminicola]|uniref:Universal stress protein UspA n=1 Tax=Ferrimonas sediminicola TaxID=2569538 RepID=A0A4U1BH49_9GAMM|nr:universal stress protein [Ferrimonas sediminicola]TKB49341.1 universal stress protein UspA [Ferrimonas sediminicola]
MSKMLIVAPRDDNQFDALAKGVELAQTLKMEPEVVGYCHESMPAVDGMTPELVESIKNRLMSDLNDSLRTRVAQLGGGVPVTVRWAEYLAEDVTDLADQGASLIVKAYRKSDHLLPTDWHLIRQTRVPLMLLTDNHRARAEDVLVALDLGGKNEAKQMLNQQLLHHAKALVAATGGELHLAYVVHLSQVIRDLEVIDTRQLVKDVYRQHALLLESLGLPKDNIHVMVGDEGRCLPQLAAKLQVGYFVIGARQRKGLLGYVMGNTAEEILSKMHSHLLVVPHFDQ